MPDVEPSIAHLDFPVCECEMESCGGQCTNEATHRIEIHALDHCASPNEGLNEDGNRTLKLCAPCYETLRAIVSQYVIRLTQHGRPMCVGCGAPITCVKQVIREAKKL